MMGCLNGLTGNLGFENFDSKLCASGRSRPRLQVLAERRVRLGTGCTGSCSLEVSDLKFQFKNFILEIPVWNRLNQKREKRYRYSYRYSNSVIVRCLCVNRKARQSADQRSIDNPNDGGNEWSSTCWIWFVLHPIGWQRRLFAGQHFWHMLIHLNEDLNADLNADRICVWLAQYRQSIDTVPQYRHSNVTALEEYCHQYKWHQ